MSREPPGARQQISGQGSSRPPKELGPARASSQPPRPCGEAGELEDEGDSGRDGEGGKQSGGLVQTAFVEDFSWGRSFAKFIGKGYTPPDLKEKLAGLDLIEQLFVIRCQMKKCIRYESGLLTARRPSKNRGMNKPVTYASNIWNRGYANCAGLCIVFVAVLRELGVPYCVVSAQSRMPKVPRHALVQVGFPEDADTKEVNGRAHDLWVQYYGKKVTIRKDKETQEPKWIKLFRGLKFTRSREGSAAAKHKGAGRWLWADPGVNVGYYLHLIENGYMIQDEKGFSFVVTPEIKACFAPGQDESFPEESNADGEAALDVKDADQAADASDEDE